MIRKKIAATTITVMVLLTLVGCMTMMEFPDISDDNIPGMSQSFLDGKDQIEVGSLKMKNPYVYRDFDVSMTKAVMEIPQALLALNYASVENQEIHAFTYKPLASKLVTGKSSVQLIYSRGKDVPIKMGKEDLTILNGFAANYEIPKGGFLQFTKTIYVFVNPESDGMVKIGVSIIGIKPEELTNDQVLNAIAARL